MAHAREGTMFALWIDRSPRRALELARENLKHPREPLDLLVLAQAAAANQAATAPRDAATLTKAMGLRDKRTDALLSPWVFAGGMLVATPAHAHRSSDP